MSDAVHDALIGRLAGELAPVRRLQPPGLRALTWLAGIVVLALILARFADLAALRARLMGVPDMGLAVLGSVLTAIAAATAAFQTSVPGRAPGWAWLPVPAALLWIGASGLGCLRAWVLPGTHVASMGEAEDCLMFLLEVSLPLSLLLLWMLRRACPLRPGLTAMLGGLACAAAAASLLTFFHPYDAAATDLAVHLGTVIVIVLGTRLWGGIMLRTRPMAGLRATK